MPSTSGTPATPDRDPAWRGRLTLIVVACVLLWPMLIASEFKPWQLWDRQSLAASGRFLSDLFPPESSPEFLKLVAIAAWETVAMATAGLTLALAGAVPLALLATDRLSVSRLGAGRMHWLGAALRRSVRWLLIVLRSVPELVWALLFVRIAGLGPTAGVLAIALTYCGMLGKVYAEILDAADPSATDALLRNGGGRLASLFFGALPQAASELVSYTVYRWECAVRGSVIMGFVGAGGLGQRMDEAVRMLAGGEVMTILIVFMLLVAVADGISKLLRTRLA